MGENYQLRLDEAASEMRMRQYQDAEERKARNEMPLPTDQGRWRDFKSKLGFEAIWHCYDRNVAYPNKPGYSIRFCRPDGQMTEEKFFPHGQEKEAQIAYDLFAQKAKSFDSIQPPPKKKLGSAPIRSDSRSKK